MKSHFYQVERTGEETGRESVCPGPGRTGWVSPGAEFEW